MFLTTPARLLKLLASGPWMKNQELGIRRRLSESYLLNRDLWPTQAQQQAAAQFLTERTGLIWSDHKTMEVLSLYPFARIKLAKHGLSSTHGVHAGLENVAANFFLHCRWPIYRDQVDMNCFLELLREQGETMGFPRLYKPSDAMSPEERRVRFTLIPGGPA